jgi:bis(5'-nucleosyl)-tetraphosphatase (symmetrical)
MAIYCIGDVQGCYRELQKLLDVIGPSLKSDTLWFVGDLVNRGPDSLAVLRFVKELPRKVVVLGNHDFHLLALFHNIIHPAQHTLHEVLAAADCAELVGWLQRQPLLHRDDQLGYVLTHAGIYPFWDIIEAQQYAAEVAAKLLNGSECQALLQHMYGDEPTAWSDELRGWERLRFIINCFTRMRFCDAAGNLEFTCQGPPGTQPRGYMPWFMVPRRKVRDTAMKIVFGHWAALAGKVDATDVFALDTGCVWGNYLTAMRLQDNELFQVKC